jgi:predicted KAP-like P-loop ATPase
MEQIYNSDKPITLKEQDRFNRHKFSNRIAETIIKRENNDGLVIGLYGIWGEGKTSVLNMIEEKIKEDENTLIAKFNPWRFKDEDTLILNFFKNISEVLNKELNTKTEKIGVFLKKYGAVTSVFNLDLSKVGETFSDIQLEILKNRINDFLEESEKKIIVVIDDIDRLDKQELFSLFKLIKLTGDFSKTYYILSFDDEMVASAIGERYAAGNINSGHNFLEKIIQVPLRIPQALSKDLLNYTFELLNKTLKENEVELEEIEAQNIGSTISNNILIKIKTPRLAIRYVNSLSFLIPLLKGEVNMSDLILFEGVKIFYPKYYDYIKKSPEYFIESYQNSFTNNKDNDKIEEFKNKIQELNNGLSKKESKSILNLIKLLFPRVREALENYSYRNQNLNWEKEKRIVSPKYFNRYFIYSIAKDDISDIYFDGYISSLKEKSLDDIVFETNKIFETVEPSEYLNKISFYEDDLDWTSRKVIINTICHFQEKFEGLKGGSFMFGFQNPKSQAAITISRILLKYHEYSERLEFSKYLMTDKIPLEFSMELIRWFKVGKAEEEQTIRTSDLFTLKNILLNRALSDCKKLETNIFANYENYIFTLLETWFEKKPKELKDYIANLVKSNPKFSITIIDSLTTTIHSSSNPNPYKVDFNKESYELLKKYYNIEKLKSIIISEYSVEIQKEKVMFFDTDEGQSNVNALRQFIHWYNLDTNTAMSQEIK